MRLMSAQAGYQEVADVQQLQEEMGNWEPEEAQQDENNGSASQQYRGMWAGEGQIVRRLVDITLNGLLGVCPVADTGTESNVISGAFLVELIENGVVDESDVHETKVSVCTGGMLIFEAHEEVQLELRWGDNRPVCLPFLVDHQNALGINLLIGNGLHRLNPEGNKSIYGIPSMVEKELYDAGYTEVSWLGKEEEIGASYTKVSWQGEVGALAERHVVQEADFPGRGMGRGPETTTQLMMLTQQETTKSMLGLTKRSYAAVMTDGAQDRKKTTGIEEPTLTLLKGTKVTRVGTRSKDRVVQE